MPLTDNFPAVSYWVDAWQRALLFCDVMRQRGNIYHERLSRIAPHVLKYQAELVVDGRTLERPVNYGLVRIVPPAGIEVDTTLRPFVIVDPRAGHGPGIGGFKADSEIGVALKAGHPCYFVGFLPQPVVGQTLEDVALAEAIFLQKVIDLHPDADGTPCVIGNCQAGWAVMMLAAIRPELFGPLIVAGSPLSYWAGVHGGNPMRYSGGLLGGSWLTALTSDLGRGIFDGAWLVQNFENLNPANTLWSKQYNLFANIDTETDRYLDFESWWGGHIDLNAEEIQFIVDNLFIGNKLASGDIQSSNGFSIDLRNIRSPIVVFCSKADNITPPQQALDWILDLYENVDEIRSYGQTIVYTLHDSLGHLGLFVSSSAARKQHHQLASNIDLIDVLPPGLYEAKFEPKTEETVNPDLASGDWVMRCEARTVDDIRALGGNNADDERRFAAAARVSERNLALYRSFAQPWVRAVVSKPVADWIHRLHPLRLQYELSSDANPAMAVVARLAPWVREHRSSAAPDNPFLVWQEHVSEQIVTMLDMWRDTRDAFSETAFLAIYGSPLVQSFIGIDPTNRRPMRHAGRSVLHRELVRFKIDELKSQIPGGGLREAVIRATLYVGMGRGAVDARGFEIVRRLRRAQVAMPRLPLSEFKTLARQQFFMLLVDQKAALEALPALLPTDESARKEAFAIIREVVYAQGRPGADVEDRLQQVALLFGIGKEAPPKLTVVPARTASETQREAS